MRAVIDTNVLVAALINRTGRPAQIVKLVSLDGVLVLTHKLLGELTEVLERPYFAARIEARSRAAFPLALARIARFVEPTEVIRACRDPRTTSSSKRQSRATQVAS